MSNIIQSARIAYISTFCLMAMASVVLVNRYLIRQAEAERAEIASLEEVQSVWNYIAARAEALGEESVDNLPDRDFFQVDAYIVRPGVSEEVGQGSYLPLSRNRRFNTLLSYPLTAALKGQSGRGIGKNYRGEEVIFVYGPVGLDGDKPSDGPPAALVVEADLRKVRSRLLPWWYRVAEITAVVACGLAVILLLLLISQPKTARLIIREQLGYDVCEMMEYGPQSGKQLSVLMHALERSNVLLVVFNAQGKILVASPRASQLTGVKVSELKGRSVFDFLPARMVSIATKSLAHLSQVTWSSRSIRIRVCHEYQQDCSKAVVANVHRMVLDGVVVGVLTAIEWHDDRPLGRPYGR